MKLVKSGAIPLTSATGLDDIMQRLMEPDDLKACTPGRFTEFSIGNLYSAYIQDIVKPIDVAQNYDKKGKGSYKANHEDSCKGTNEGNYEGNEENITEGIKVVVDAGNGMATTLAPIIKQYHPYLREQKLFFGLDGDFPNRGSYVSMHLIYVLK